MKAPTTSTVSRRSAATGHPHACPTTQFGSVHVAWTSSVQRSVAGVHGADRWTAAHNVSHAARIGSNGYIARHAYVGSTGDGATWPRVPIGVDGDCG